jgi:hypothetical protein
MCEAGPAHHDRSQFPYLGMDTKVAHVEAPQK